MSDQSLDRASDISPRLDTGLWIAVREHFGQEGATQFSRELMEALEAARSEGFRRVNEVVHAWYRSVRLAKDPRFRRSLELSPEEVAKIPVLTRDEVADRLTM